MKLYIYPIMLVFFMGCFNTRDRKKNNEATAPTVTCKSNEKLENKICVPKADPNFGLSDCKTDDRGDYTVCKCEEFYGITRQWINNVCTEVRECDIDEQVSGCACSRNDRKPDANNICVAWDGSTGGSSNSNDLPYCKIDEKIMLSDSENSCICNDPNRKDIKGLCSFTDAKDGFSEYDGDICEGIITGSLPHETEGEICTCSEGELYLPTLAGKWTCLIPDADEGTTDIFILKEICQNRLDAVWDTNQTWSPTNAYCSRSLLLSK